MMIGSTPTVVWSRMRARTRSPCFSDAAREAMSTPAAPSESGDEVPAVTRPPSGRKTGLSAASDSIEVPGRTAWSARRSSPSSGIRTISASKRWPAIASAARACERTANSSICSRVMPQRSAMSSALSPCGTKSYSSRISAGQASPYNSSILPTEFIGTWPMCSTPAPITSSCIPEAT